MHAMHLLSPYRGIGSNTVPSLQTQVSHLAKRPRPYMPCLAKISALSHLGGDSGRVNIHLIGLDAGQGLRLGARGARCCLLRRLALGGGLLSGCGSCMAGGKVRLRYRALYQPRYCEDN